MLTMILESFYRKSYWFRGVECIHLLSLFFLMSFEPNVFVFFKVGDSIYDEFVNTLEKLVERLSFLDVSY